MNRVLRHKSAFYVKLVQFNRRFEELQRSMEEGEEEKGGLERAHRFRELVTMLRYFGVLKNHLYNAQVKRTVES